MDEGIERGETFLKEIVEKIGLECSIESREEDGKVFVDIKGEGPGLLIGYHGRTLHALQLLLSIVINKGEENRRRVILDIENYRENRERKLEQLAEREAEKAMEMNSAVALSPMSAYERRIVHTTLAEDRRVETRSEGEEPSRRVVIVPKD